MLITHGLLMRIFCMAYFKWTVQEFEQVWNPTNGEIWVLEKEPSGEYEFAGRWRATPYGGAFVDVKASERENVPSLHRENVPSLRRGAFVDASSSAPTRSSRCSTT